MHPNDGRVVSNFIMQALRGMPLTVYGDGAQTRSFCYVDDMIDGLDRLMCSPRDCCGPVNLGNPVECTMLDLAEKIIAITGSHSPIVFRPLPSDDPGRRCPDIALAKSLFGWQSTVDLEEGLRRTVDYFRRPPSTLGTNQHTRIGMTNSSLSQAART
jgi:UDP-glucuronate decarboxylase